MNRTIQIQVNFRLEMLLRLLSSLITLTFLLALPQTQAAIGSAFTVDQLKYIVYTENLTTQTGTVSVEAASKETFDDITIPSTVVNDGIEYSVTLLPNYSFAACVDLTSIIIPDSVTFIGSYAFSDCSSLTNITTLGHITSIGESTFSKCSSLTNIKIPDSVIEIGEWAFSECSSLTSIIIPANVTSIGWDAFSECNNLTDVYFKGNAPTTEEGWAFSAPALIYYRPGTKGWTNPWQGRPATVWIEPPSITEQPRSQAVMEGDLVTFSVVAEGAKPLKYQWYKEDVLLEGAIEANYTIANVSAEDLGGYAVVVSNVNGETRSVVATLTLRAPCRATATVQVENGFVVGLTITDGGCGYTEVPNIRIKDETGRDATGHCIVENGVVTQIIVDNPGLNYSSGATVLIGSPVSNDSLKINVAEVKVKMHLVLGMEYQLWSSLDAFNWEKVGEPFTAEEEEMIFFFEVIDYGRFFKLQEI